MSRNLIIRILVSVIAIPGILWICYRGGDWLLGMVLVMALTGGAEFLIGEGFRPGSFYFWAAEITIGLMVLLWSDYAGLVVTDQGLALGGEDSLLLLISFFLLIGMLLSMRNERPQELFQKFSRLVWGVAYMGLLYPFVLRLGGGFENISGGDCLLFLFAILWVGDTAAMGVGKWLGKHKLAPTVSPNKTVEGFFGGIAGAAIVSIAFFYWKALPIGYWHILAVAVGCSLFGQLGDLVESMWKRSLGIKDSSALIPGHGGLLDRFDSLVFAAPFMFCYFSYVMP